MPNNSSLQPENFLDSEYTPKGRIYLDQGLLTSSQKKSNRNRDKVGAYKSGTREAVEISEFKERKKVRKKIATTVIV
jgi:hypothetical protein